MKFLSCASLGSQTRDVSGLPLQGKFLGKRGGGPAAACLEGQACTGGVALQLGQVSVTELNVTSDKRVMIYWENCPIKNTLEDPVYCLIPFKHSTVTNTPYNYKLKKGGKVILPHTV